ncbi:hypothetical protein [uncultured Rikenella sp.]|uniref:hypothetical protein n=1 Tax=uncultured Rikenella sp. TaxID=368003 RepID=UPI002631FE06|nr:hypothetical protein [uncultured Rikenella sp.]
MHPPFIIPAPGFREKSNGELVSIDNGGFSYSSSVGGNHGMSLNFSVTYLYPSSSDYRAYGFQLRCLSE